MFNFFIFKNFPVIKIGRKLAVENGLFGSLFEHFLPEHFDGVFCHDNRNPVIFFNKLGNQIRHFISCNTGRNADAYMILFMHKFLAMTL